MVINHLLNSGQIYIFHQPELPKKINGFPFQNATFWGIFRDPISGRVLYILTRYFLLNKKHTLQALELWGHLEDHPI